MSRFEIRDKFYLDGETVQGNFGSIRIFRTVRNIGRTGTGLKNS